MRNSPRSSERFLCTCLLLWAGAGPLAAQQVSPPDSAGCEAPRIILRPEAPRDAVSDYLRIAELQKAGTAHSQVIVRPSSPESETICSARAPWLPVAAQTTDLGAVELTVLPIHAGAIYNSAYAEDHNNGAIWAGRGISTAVTAGLRFRAGAFSAALAPIIAWQANRGFPTYPQPDTAYSMFSYRLPGRGTGQIDWPQRFGDNSFTTVTAGNSYARFDLAGVGVGISSENLWWGPGRINSLLLTNTAAGFPHVFLGTTRPLDIWVGKLYAETLWGHLTESDFYDHKEINDTRLLTGITMTFAPRGLDGLELGWGRTGQQILPPSGLPTSQYFTALTGLLFREKNWDERGGKGDPLDQLFAVFFRWRLPDAGFELYGEWGWTDSPWNRRHFIVDPAYTDGWVAGLQKVYGKAPVWWRFNAEVITLTRSLAWLTYPEGSFYVNGQAKQGYTHHGQLLGSSVGPGGSMQNVVIDRFTASGRLGLFLERYRRDADAFFNSPMLPSLPPLQDVQLGGGLSGMQVRDRLAVEWTAGYYVRLQKYFAPEDDRNLRLQLDVAWTP